MHGPQIIKVVINLADNKGHKLISTGDLKKLVPLYDKYLSWVKGYTEM